MTHSITPVQFFEDDSDTEHKMMNHLHPFFKNLVIELSLLEGKGIYDDMKNIGHVNHFE